MSSPNETLRQWVQVALLVRPRGNKGEVVAELMTDFPDRLATLRSVYLAKPNQEPKPVALQKFWVDRNHPGYGVFHFHGVSSINEAETLRGLGVFLPFVERVQLPAGQYFVTDLIGCTVFDNPAGESKLSSPACAAETAPVALGSVRDVFFPGEGQAGTPLLQLLTAQGELLIPLADDICTRIDVAARRIDVRLPEGLRSVNAPE